jgi:hypothetical protein
VGLSASGRLDEAREREEWRFGRLPKKRKEPPGNRAAPSSGRIVPTEAKPLELSGCIVGAQEGSVKEKSKKK